MGGVNGESPLSCETARPLLWPLDGPRLWRDGEDDARDHLRACAECEDFFRRDAALARALRTHGVAARAPQELRERVFEAVALERGRTGGGGASPSARAAGDRPRRESWLDWMPLAAAVALMAIPLGLHVAGDDRPENAYVHDFLNRALEESTVVPTAPQEVSSFFRRELGVGIEPVQPPGARLRRAMICLIRGQRAAMVEYELDGHTVAHYRRPLRSTPGGGTAEPRVVSEGGLTVVRWRDEAFEHAVIGDLSRARVVALATGSFAAP